MSAGPASAQVSVRLLPRLDWVGVLLGALLLWAWDRSGWDLTVSRWFGDGGGFAWRDAWLTNMLLHQGGRALAWCLVALLLVHVWQPLPLVSKQQTRSQRGWMLVAVLLCIALVPMLKQFSVSSCPWDLREFGGVAAYVSHWDAILQGLRDGGPGRCFPSGHAVAAFGFLPVYFALRRHERQRARGWWWAIVFLGLLYGTAQLVRGAHYVSHTLWSAWSCWTLALCLNGWVVRR
ncbi:MAG: phosphatase PAP2 family protein [Burkholderiales bacterium]